MGDYSKKGDSWVTGWSRGKGMYGDNIVKVQDILERNYLLLFYLILCIFMYTTCIQEPSEIKQPIATTKKESGHGTRVTYRRLGAVVWVLGTGSETSARAVRTFNP